MCTACRPAESGAETAGASRAEGGKTVGSAPSGVLCAQPLEVIRSRHNIGVRGREFDALFSVLNGGLVSYRYAGKEMIKEIPRPNFWRAPVDNDEGNQMPKR